LKGRFKIFNTYFPYDFSKQKQLHSRYEADDIFELEERRAEWARGTNEDNGENAGTSDLPTTVVDEGAKAMEKSRAASSVIAQLQTGKIALAGYLGTFAIC
jgi:hypothetical protein